MGLKSVKNSKNLKNMKKHAFFMIGLVFSTTLVYAQNQNEIGLYSGTKIDLDKGIQLSTLDDYLVLTGITDVENSGNIEVFLRRGDDAVTVTEFKPQNGTLVIPVKEILHEEAKFKSGDKVVIKVTSKEIYTIPVK